IGDDRRDPVRRIEQPVGQRTEPEPGGRCREDDGADADRPTTSGHRLTLASLMSMVAVAVRPDTSGAYISSTCAGATTKDPAVVARTTYENSWCPSASRVAKSSTRSSWRSTRSKVPRFQTSSQRGASVPSCSSVCLATSAAVVLNHDSTGSKPA